MGVNEEPIWDGNGGTLDPKKTPQRDLLVALHVKMDSVVIPRLETLTAGQQELDKRLRAQEDGDLTRGQQKAVEELVQGDKDRVLTRRSSWAPIVAVLIALASLGTTLTLALTVGGTS